MFLHTPFLKNNCNKRRKALITFCFSLLLISSTIYAQVPTVQDCLGAIPICQNTYQTAVSYSGHGNYAAEIDSNNSCLLQGEENDVWYTFTVQNSGTLSFLITANDITDDYDWAIYNLTNHNCGDIYTNPGIEISCNYASNFGANGLTGANGGVGPQYNPTIPVLAGETYVINVSNYSGTANGFTIDFSASTAIIFDNIPPVINSIITFPECGETALSFQFSENVLCNSVQAADFTVTGPDGNHTVNTITSTACTNGANYDKSFDITFNPPILLDGVYCLNIVGPVTDLCGNVALPACFQFTVTPLNLLVQTTGESCFGSQDGSATAVGSGSTAGIYNYNWNTGETTSSIDNLAPGSNYSVTLSINGACPVIQSYSITGSLIAISSTITVTSIDTCEKNTGTIDVAVSGGTPGYDFIWQPAGPNSSINNGLSLGTYSVVVSDANGCTTANSAEITTLCEELIIYVPNAFIPNENGENDVFLPQLTNFKENTFEMYIFNRWGSLLYQTNNPWKGWDGSGKNVKQVELGVYIYKILVKDLNNMPFEVIGHVTLLR